MNKANEKYKSNENMINSITFLNLKRAFSPNPTIPERLYNNKDCKNNKDYCEF